MPDVPPAEFLVSLTVPIRTAAAGEQVWSGAGTGFFLQFQREKDLITPLIITNKHVLHNAERVGLTLHALDENNRRRAGPGSEVIVEGIDKYIIQHPSPDVDIAAIIYGPIYKFIIRSYGWTPFHSTFEVGNIPNLEQWTQFSALEDLIMPGYPIGLVDYENNLPIIRRGITATPCSSDYQGRHEFLADIAVFPGSSGSPVVLLNQGAFTTPQGVFIGNRLWLLGILYAGHYQIASGEVISAPAPTSTLGIAEVQQMIHLGICVRSTRLLDLESLIVQ